MRLRTTLASALAASALGLSALIAAPAANAAATPSTLYVHCGSGQVSAFSDAARQTPVTGITADSGDTMTVVFQTGDGSPISPGNNCGDDYYYYPGNTTVTVDASTGDVTRSITLSTADFPTMFDVLMNDQASGGLFLSITYSGGGGGGGGGSSSDSSSATAPAPVVQQFGLPATGTCNEAQPEGLNWSGVTSGGWGLSWAQWMHGGTGGAVCTRTLVYSTAQSKWIVN